MRKKLLKFLHNIISSIIENKLDNIKDRNGKIRKQIELSNKIIDTLSRFQMMIVMDWVLMRTQNNYWQF
jgi:hypothetical protein